MVFDFDKLPGRQNHSGDYCVAQSGGSRTDPFDVLIFADSRGILLDNPRVSWTRKLFRFLTSKGMRVMVVVRPKDLTGCFTLFNFLESAGLQFRYAVCQAGPNEFTAKTDALLQDMLAQKAVLFPDQEIAIRQTPDKSLVLKPGEAGAPPLAEYEHLSAVDVNTMAIKSRFVALLEKHFKYALLLGAVEMTQNAKIARIRAQSFFDQIRRSNAFLQELGNMSSCIHYVEPIKEWRADVPASVHDGLHYTVLSHQNIYGIVRSILLGNLGQ